MNMNKKIMTFVVLLFSIFFMKNNVFAADCNYKTSDSETVAKYNKNDKNIKILKFKNQPMDQKSGKVKKLTKCYKYISIELRHSSTGSAAGFVVKYSDDINKVDASNRSTEQLNLIDTSSNTGDNSSSDTNNSSDKICDLEYEDSILNSYNWLNGNKYLKHKSLDLGKDKITFSFITKNGNRTFKISSNNKDYSVDFIEKNLTPVKTKIKDATFTIETSDIDDFFDCKVRYQDYNIKRNNRNYTLYKVSEKENSDLEEWKQKECSELSDSDCKKRQDCQMVGGTCSDAEIAKDPCNEKSIRQVLKFFGYLLMIAKFVVPFILIGFAVYDLYKSIIDKDEKALKTKLRMIMFRIIAGVTVFFVPDLVWVGFKYIEKSNITGDQYQVCAECVLKPSSNELCTVEDNSTNE